MSAKHLSVLHCTVASSKFIPIKSLSISFLFLVRIYKQDKKQHKISNLICYLESVSAMAFGRVGQEDHVLVLITIGKIF